MEDKLFELLEEEYPDIDFRTDADLIDDGLIDSLTIVGMISLISMEFNVKLPFEEIVPQNFNSVHAMAEMLKKYVK